MAGICFTKALTAHGACVGYLRSRQKLGVAMKSIKRQQRQYAKENAREREDRPEAHTGAGADSALRRLRYLEKRRMPTDVRGDSEVHGKFDI
jgi:hypothetical protein